MTAILLGKVCRTDACVLRWCKDLRRLHCNELCRGCCVMCGVCLVCTYCVCGTTIKSTWKLLCVSHAIGWSAGHLGQITFYFQVDLLESSIISKGEWVVLCSRWHKGIWLLHKSRISFKQKELVSWYKRELGTNC